MKIEGRNPVIEALKSDRTIETLYVAKGTKEGSIQKIVAMAKEKKIILKEVDRKKLDEMSESHSHQGVIALVSEYRYYELEELLEIPMSRGEDPFFLILDEITDPHNLGALVRSAEGAGVHGIIIPKRRSATVTPVVEKASAGAIEHMAIAKVSNIAQTIEKLKKLNIWIAAIDMDGQEYYKQDMTGALGLVIGSEGYGISRIVKEKCDFSVKIPMVGKVTSLNASVAGGILMFEVLKQRTNGK